VNSTSLVIVLRELPKAVGSFLANQSGSSAQIMGATSIMVAGVFGLGIVALNFDHRAPQTVVVQDETAAAELMAALNAEFNTNLSEMNASLRNEEEQVPSVVAAFDLALRLDSADDDHAGAPLNASTLDLSINDLDADDLDEVAAAEPVTEEMTAPAQLASFSPALAPVREEALPVAAAPAVTAMDASLPTTTDTPQTELPAIRTASFMPIIDEDFRSALMNGTVDVFNRALPVMEQAVVSIQSGDTMMDLLTNFGIDRTEAYYAIEAFGEVFNPRRIRAGQEFNVAYEVSPTSEEESAAEEFRLVNLSMRTAADREVIVEWDEDADNFVGVARDIVLEERFTRGRGTIDSSLYMAANGMGVPDAMTINMIRIFSHSVDFQRDIRTGDDFDIFYSRHHDETGEAVQNGDVIFASMTTRGRERNLYRFTTEDDGDTDYYDENGQSVRAFLMRTPIDGARITSNFGARRHPVLGYNRMHKGVDFGAPRGTPIYAAGNGTVVRASAFGSFGNYVRIRHANGYETAYAHMNAYGPGIRSGVRVEQGQIIGYVGATGRVTGAHLHYEVFMGGEQVNPRTIELPSGRELEGDMLTAFQQHRIEIDAQMAEAYTLGNGETASLDVNGASAN